MSNTESIFDIKNRCEEIRSFIIDKISKEGGYLTNNLSNIEACVALESIITDNDILVCDDKYLTLSLEKLNIKNIIYNNTNSLSYCLGLLDSNKYDHIYLLLNSINDDLVSTFVYLKARNGNYNKLTIIFNDNNNSQLAFINRNIFTNNPAANLIKNNLKKVRKNINNKSLDNLDNTLTYLKNINPFDSSVFSYIQINDDINELLTILNKQNNKIKFIQYLSIKGKGYLFSQENPYRYFYTKPFNIATGRLLSEENNDNLYTKNIIGKTIEDLINQGNEIYCLVNNIDIDYGINNIIAKHINYVIEKDLVYKRLINYGLALASNKLVYMPMLAKDFNENIYMFKDKLNINSHLVIGVINNSDIDYEILKELNDVYVYETYNSHDLQNLMYSIKEFNRPIIIIFANKCLKYQKNTDFNTKELGKWDFLVNNDMKEVIISSGVQINNIYKSIIDNNLNISLINSGFISSIDKDIINNLYSNNSKVYVYNSVVEAYLRDYLIKNDINLNVEYLSNVSIQELLSKIG